MVGGSLGSFKASPYGADHNLLPHLKLELDAASPLGKHINARQAPPSAEAESQLQQKIRSSLVSGWTGSVAVDADTSPPKTQQSLPGIMDPEKLDIPGSYHGNHRNCCNDDNTLSLRCLAFCCQIGCAYDPVHFSLQDMRHPV